MPKRAPQGGKVADPLWRSERAAKASRAARDISVQVRAIERRAGELTPEYIEKLRAVVDAAPPLTPAQRTKLTALLLDGGGADGS